MDQQCIHIVGNFDIHNHYMPTFLLLLKSYNIITTHDNKYNKNNVSAHTYPHRLHLFHILRVEGGCFLLFIEFLM